MTNIRRLNFCPLRGLSSRHLQTILPIFMRAGKAPKSAHFFVDLDDGDQLRCEVSCPPNWKEADKTVVMVHGLGGSHNSSYMIRMARKLYEAGKKTVRVNLRGSGTGKGLAKRPYNAGTSKDLLEVIKVLKKVSPQSELTVVGFSLGGNVVLKLAGELGSEAEKWVDTFIAVSPPFDLAHTVRLLEKWPNYFYHRYYLKMVSNQGQKWVKDQKIDSLFDFDNLITAPLWSYKGAEDYYNSSSSRRFLPEIKQKTHILSAQDDPFVSLEVLDKKTLPSPLNIWVTQYGGHMGFIGKAPKQHGANWLDHLLLNWIEKNYIIDFC